MARKDYFVAKDTPHPLYRTRMLTAGVPIPLDASAARLYGKLGVELLDEAPRRGGSTMIAHEPQVRSAPTPAPNPAAKPARKRKAATKKK